MLNSWERFRDARIVHNIHGKQTMDAVSAATGVSKNMISRLETDPYKDTDKPKAEAGVNWQAVALLAKYYGVSADYLLGLAEEVTPDQSLQAVCQFTGLSAEAAELLHATKVDGFTSRLVDAVLCAEGVDSDLQEAITDSAQAVIASAASQISDLLGIQRDINNRIATISRSGKTEYYISAEHAADLYLSRAIEIATSNISAVIRKMRDDLSKTLLNATEDRTVPIEIEIIKVDESEIPSK